MNAAVNSFSDVLSCLLQNVDMFMVLLNANCLCYTVVGWWVLYGHITETLSVTWGNTLRMWHVQPITHCDIIATHININKNECKFLSMFINKYYWNKNSLVRNMVYGAKCNLLSDVVGNYINITACKDEMI